MERKMKRIVTLSNSTKSTGQGVPERVSASQVERDFFDTYIEKKRENRAQDSHRPRHQGLDMYSTVT